MKILKKIKIQRCILKIRDLTEKGRRIIIRGVQPI